MAAIGSVGQSGLYAITQAQTSLNSTARKIAQGPPEAADVAQLLQAKEQFSVGTKLLKTEDDLTGKLLDILA